MTLYFEKPNKVNWGKIAYITLAVFLAGAGLLLLALAFIPQVYWDKLRIADVTAILAQLATASAFVLAAFQFRKNRIADRQNVIISESKEIIKSMLARIQNYNQSDLKSFHNYTSYMMDMNEMQGDYNHLFGELSEDINKGILRMHWQGMYLKHFEQSNEWPILDDIYLELGISDTVWVRHRGNYYAKAHLADDRSPKDMLSRYKEYKYVLQKIHEEGYKLKLGDYASTLVIFEDTFFTERNLNDHFYGLLNQADARVAAPLLAALNETANKNTADSLRKSMA